MILKLLLLIFHLVKTSIASVGDSSPFYSRCVQECNRLNCDSEFTFELNPLGLGISFWSCLENCEYQCQWKTVASFQNKNWAVPQFKGKWPFIRLFGLQEPASTIFSIFNFFIHLKMLLTFRKKVPNSSPYYNLWHVYAFICFNAWVWSSIYHARDTDFTERMDYISAFLMVTFSFYSMGLRFISNTLNLKTFIWSIFCGSICLNHLAYLWLYNFDYGYNMKLNCLVGMLNALGWFLWTFFTYKLQNYSWKISAYAFFMVLSTSLELLDFPPIFWFVDAHALWHLSTGFITIWLYDFLIDDCNYLNEIKTEKLPWKMKSK